MNNALSFKLLLHQDFYSHSNWVEMGQHFIYLHLLQPDEPAVPVATGKSHLHICMYVNAHVITSKTVITGLGAKSVLLGSCQFTAELYHNDFLQDLLTSSGTKASV